MSRVFVHGLGAVSPAGWGFAPLRDAVAKGKPLPIAALERPGWDHPLSFRRVPAPQAGETSLRHPRLRRSSPIAQFTAAAGMEALGSDAQLVTSGKLRLGILLCVMSGCVNYTRRFFEETLKDPATASPLVFPETVFNSPASHLAAILGTPAINYTMVGDPGTFLQALALAADWLNADQVDGCLVIGAEECDWMIADAFRLFTRQLVLSDGAGAIYLRKEQTATALAELECVTDSYLFTRSDGRPTAARKARAELPTADNLLLVDGLIGVSPVDAAEVAAWEDWGGSRISPKLVLGEGMMAAAGWQCVVAVDALKLNGYSGVNVSVVGCNQQAIAAHFKKA